MNEFFAILKRFVPPYKKYLALNVFFNVLSAFLTLFSFAVIIPILEMLFKVKEATYTYMDAGSGSIKEVAVNNFYYYTQEAINTYGPTVTLALLAALLVVMDRPEDRGHIPCLLLRNSDAQRYRARHP